MMPVKSVPTMGWTRSSAALTILAVTEAQQREMGARVAELRDAQGMTNESLARKSGLSVKTVSRFTHGKHEPRGNTVGALAKALKVTEDYIRGTPAAPLGLAQADGPTFTERLERLEEIALQNQRMLIALATERGLIPQTAAVELRRDLEPLLRQIEEAAGQGQPAKRRAPVARRRATG